MCGIEFCGEKIAFHQGLDTVERDTWEKGDVFKGGEEVG